MKEDHLDSKTLIYAGIALLIILALGTWVFLLFGENKNLESEMAELRIEQAALDKHNQELEDELRVTQEANAQLAQELSEEQEKNEEFEEQIEDLAGTVGKLDQLSRTDPELLIKYSKVYFLNENYVPQELEKIDDQYTFQDKDLSVNERVWPFLEDLLEEAEDDDIELLIISAFRSFGEQSSLKNSYVVTYGAGTANQFSAEQGYSEHQLGTTVDFSTEGLGANFTSFAGSEAYQWLLDNAYKYGFILSYPEGNSYYQFEPWHWRFVGKSLAQDLHQDEKNFYDLDQREIDKYLIEIFDR